MIDLFVVLLYPTTPLKGAATLTRTFNELQKLHQQQLMKMGRSLFTKERWNYSNISNGKLHILGSVLTFHF